MSGATHIWHQTIAPAARRAGAMLRRAADRGFDAGYQPDADARPAQAETIELQNIALAYGKQLALADVTGRFIPGSLTAIVGPNGAGKSSLLDLLAGTRRPTTGNIRRPAGRRLAFLPQQAALDRDYPITVGEVAALGLWRQFGAWRRPPPDTARRLEAALTAVGIASLAARRIGELSAGQLQRVLFARLILQNATAILLDEPFAAIDEATTIDLLALVTAWHREGRTVIAVVHDLGQVRAHFPRTLLLARTPIAWGDTADVLTEANLAMAR